MSEPADVTRRKLLAEIIAVVNRYQGAFPDRAMAEIEDVLMTAMGDVAVSTPEVDRC